MYQFPFDSDKGLEVLLYIFDQCNSFYRAPRVLYYADKQHLSKYGRSICGGSYHAILAGPVHNELHDWILDMPLDDEVRLPKRSANPSYLSETDREVLDKAIAKYGHMSYFEALRHAYKDGAYNAVNRHGEISLELIIKDLENGEELLEFLNS